MIKKIICLCSFFIIFATCLCSQTNDFERSQTIIDGLSKKLLKDRKPYIEMAMYSDSPEVFEKLRQMYRVDNKLKDDVFRAMRAQNDNNNGIFSAKLSETMLEEFNRLKSLNWSACPQNEYLAFCLAHCQEPPFSGYEDFVDYVMNNIDTVTENGVDYRTDPVKFRAGILGECIFYFALRDKPGYMQKLAGVFEREEIDGILLIIELFKERKDDRLFDTFTKKIQKRNQEKRSISTFLDSYVEYANALEKDIPDDIQKAIKLDKEEQKRLTEELFRKN